MDDLLVVGMDLVTGHSVRVGDAPGHVWKSKGYGGDGTLVCRDCLLGDGVPVGTRVPLLYRGRLHGKRRPHFAHPPGQGPIGRHHPETPWHAGAKKAIVLWAHRQPNVVDVCVEHWTPDGHRRSDVSVTFFDGTRMAIELQQQPLTDDAWLARHRDYALAGITDVWLWHPHIGVPGVALGESQSHWQLNVELNQLGIPIAEPHSLPSADFLSDDVRLAAHYPPCPGDGVVFGWCDLSQLRLLPTGLALPKHVQDLLEADRLKTLAERRARQEHAQPQDEATPNDPPGWGGSPVDVHLAHRIDSKPPWAPPGERLYRCQQECGSLRAEAIADGTHHVEDRWD
jgi:hypothetical protein